MRVRQPCAADWDTMVGDDLRRFCAACGRHVTNVDAIDDAAFAALLADGRACVRGRTDGSGRLLRAAVLLGATAVAAANAPGTLLGGASGAPAVVAEAPPLAPAVADPSPAPAQLSPDVNPDYLVAIGYID